MRLLRVGRTSSTVGDDIRAALTAIGRDEAGTGGVAVLGVDDPETGHHFDGVLVLPHAVVLVASVELPGPALHLEAPLRGEWKADGWGLVGTGTSTNPGSRALAAAESLARRLHATVDLAVPIRAILAVGPYAGTVTVPDTQLDEAQLDDSVQVLYPTSAAFREALRTFERAAVRSVCTAVRARAVLRALDPGIPAQPDSVLLHEGFADTTATSPQAGGVDPPTLGLGSETTAPQADASYGITRWRGRRLLPVAAIVVVLLVLVTALVLGAADSAGGSAGPTHRSFFVDDVEFTVVAAEGTAACAERTFGDVRGSLERTTCAGMRLGSMLADVAGKVAVVSVAEIGFTESTDAEQLRRLAADAGTGGAVDLASRVGAWGPYPPSFDHAAVRVARNHDTVELVRVSWFAEPSGPGDPRLARLAELAVRVPLAP